MNHLSFSPAGQSASGKTKFWLVRCGQQYLGDVSWHGLWRKYCFYPHPVTFFDAACLRQIAMFVEGETRRHLASGAERRAEWLPIVADGEYA